MEAKPIVKYGAPILRLKAEQVEIFDEDLTDLIDLMYRSAIAADGTGLAAPQIGVSLQVAIVDVSMYNEEIEPFPIINPEILEMEGTAVMEEGCLSLPGIYENVERAKKIVVKYFDENGNEMVVEAEDFLARVIQHEIDHLNGVLLIDHLSSVKRKLLARQLKKIAQEENSV